MATSTLDDITTNADSFEDDELHLRGALMAVQNAQAQPDLMENATEVTHVDPAIQDGESNPDFTLEAPRQDPEPAPQPTPAPPKAQASRRELSSTKRAAQNRAAQRAFRQRKEAKIAGLEHTVQKYDVLSKELESVELKNRELEKYVDTLIQCLNEASIPYPPMPEPPQPESSHDETGMSVDVELQQEAPTASMSAPEAILDPNDVSASALVDMMEGRTKLHIKQGG